MQVRPQGRVRCQVYEREDHFTDTRVCVVHSQVPHALGHGLRRTHGHHPVIRGVEFLATAQLHLSIGGTGDQIVDDANHIVDATRQCLLEAHGDIYRQQQERRDKVGEGDCAHVKASEKASIHEIRAHAITERLPVDDTRNVHHPPDGRREDRHRLHNGVLGDAVQRHGALLGISELVAFAPLVSEFNNTDNGLGHQLPHHVHDDAHGFDRLCEDEADVTQWFANIDQRAHTLPHPAPCSGKALALHVDESRVALHSVALAAHTIVNATLQLDVHVLRHIAGEMHGRRELSFRGVESDAHGLYP